MRRISARAATPPLRVWHREHGRSAENVDLRFIAEFIQVRCGSAGLQPPQRFIDGDPREPCPQSRIATEFADPAERTQIGFLHHLLGVPVIAQYAAREAPQRAVMLLNQPLRRGRHAAPKLIE